MNVLIEIDNLLLKLKRLITCIQHIKIIGEFMKTLLEELTMESDAIKMWSVVNLLFIALGSGLMLYDKSYAGLVLVGLVDELCVLGLYAIFKIKKIKAIFNTVENVGKQVLFLGLYSVGVCLLVNNLFNSDTNAINSTVLNFIIGFSVIHIIIRWFNFSEIFIWLREDHHLNMVNFFKNKPSIKYITDENIQVPYYGLVCGEFEIVHTDLRYHGKNYKTYDMLAYLHEHQKKFEDLTEEDFKMFENMKHFE